MMSSMTKATVHVKNPDKGMIALATGRQEFTIIKANTSDFTVGDRVEWDNDSALGSETYRNMTTGSAVSVIVQNHWVQPRQVQKELLL
jgi:hypothetical protein